MQGLKYFHNCIITSNIRCAAQMVKPMRTPVNWNTSPAEDTGLLQRYYHQVEEEKNKVNKC